MRRLVRGLIGGLIGLLLGWLLGVYVTDSAAWLAAAMTGDLGDPTDNIIVLFTRGVFIGTQPAGALVGATVGFMAGVLRRPARYRQQYVGENEFESKEAFEAWLSLSDN